MRINKLWFIALLPLTLASCNRGVAVTLVNDNPEIGDISNSGNYAAGSTVILQAKLNDAYVGKKLFTGWFKVEDKYETALSFENPYIYTVPNQNITIKAKWEDYSTQQFVFTNVGDTSFCVSSYYGSDKNIIIPKTHYTLPVTKIDAYTFAGLKDAESIANFDHITSIGEYAFLNSALKSITLPPIRNNSVGEYVFSGWSKEQTVYLRNESIYEGTTSIQTKWGWKLISTGVENEYKEASDTNQTCGSKEVIFKIID